MDVGRMPEVYLYCSYFSIAIYQHINASVSVVRVYVRITGWINVLGVTWYHSEIWGAMTSRGENKREMHGIFY